MAAYCTEADLVAGGLRQEVIDELTARSIDLDALIARGSGRIDTYLRSRYRLPLAEPVPEAVRDIAVALVLFYALNALGWDPETGPDRAAMLGFEDAKTRLRELSNGTAHLDIADDATPAKYEGRPKVFSIPRNLGIRSDGRIP